MKLLTSLLILLFGTAKAQVKVLIEDDDQQGFFVGVDGYLQNEDKVSALVLTSLDTIAYKINIRKGDKELSKPIHLRNSGNYKYLISEDAHGKLSLYYRGKFNVVLSSIPSLTIAQEVRWPNLPISIASTEFPEIKQNVQLETPEAKLSLPVVVTPSVIVSQDSLLKTPVPKVEKKEDPAVLERVKWDNLINELVGIDYEFERTEKIKLFLASGSISSKQLIQLLEILKYDQTRFQISQLAVQKITDPENLDLVTKSFEYQITRNQFLELIE